jgi:hypothetical protein
MIWTFSTVVLAGLLVIEGVGYRSLGGRHATQEYTVVEQPPRARTLPDWVYFSVVLVCLAGMGIQLFLLSAILTLNMMDVWDWGFG